MYLLYIILQFILQRTRHVLLQVIQFDFLHTSLSNVFAGLSR